MNVDHILQTLNRHNVGYLLIGGMNFLLRHAPVLTYDVDLWIEDTDENLGRCEEALSELDAQWGTSQEDWGPVSRRSSGWLKSQQVFCLTSPHGAIDIFRRVKGLEDRRACLERAPLEKTAGGIPYRGLSDEDMLRGEKALDEPARNQDRIRALEKATGNKRRDDQ